MEIVATLNGFDTSNDNGVKCTCIGLHPDGLILALGRNDGKVSIWDLKTEKLASTLEVSCIPIISLILFFVQVYKYITMIMLHNSLTCKPYF